MTRPGLPPRDYVIEEYTTTVCPHCFSERPRRSDEAGVFKDGMLVSHDGSIWLRRFCREHGETESLYEEDAEIWRARNGWSTPTLRVTPDRAGNYAAFPDGYRDGLPASHGQHTCILLLNVTDRCNYGCPACYASARSSGTPRPTEEQPSIEEIERTVDTVLAREYGKLGVLMLSGGEPTVRDDLPEILTRLLNRNITRIMINTNGRRIARDDRFLQFLRDCRQRIEVYLQFDGLRPSTYEALRGEDVAREKLTALRRLNEAGLFTTLMATVARGVNEDEVGEIWIHLISNTISFEGVSEAVPAMLKSGAIQRVFSEQLKVGTPELMLDLARMCDCIPGLPQILGGIWSRVGRQENALEKAAERTFRITVKMFMDAHTFHEARIRQCCVHTGTFEPDPRRYSFCWRWLFADAVDAPAPAIIPVEAVAL